MTPSVGPLVWRQADNLGTGWLAVARAILSDGVPGQWDGRPLREIFRATVEVTEPAVADPIIARLADPERLAWMHRNFTDHAQVPALGMLTATPPGSMTTRTAAGTRLPR